MKIIWDKVNDWKFWALANEQEEFYKVLLENKIHSTKGLIFEGSEPFLSMSIPYHQELKQEAQRLLDPLTYQEFVKELYGDF